MVLLQLESRHLTVALISRGLTQDICINQPDSTGTEAALSSPQPSSEALYISFTDGTITTVPCSFYSCIYQSHLHARVAHQLVQLVKLLVPDP